MYPIQLNDYHVQLFPSQQIAVKGHSGLLRQTLMIILVPKVSENADGGYRMISLRLTGQTFCCSAPLCFGGCVDVNAY